MKTVQKGFFTMDTVHAVMGYSDLEAAKAFLFSVVKESAAAREGNVTKATTMIENAKSINKLALDVSNFMLAHPSENLKSIR